MTEPDEVGWRVRAGGGLLYAQPISDALREAHQREDEREAKAVELEAQQRREAAVEHRWDLERRGIEAHTVNDVLQSAAVAADRQDRRDAKRERDAAIAMGKPEPRFDRWQSKKNTVLGLVTRKPR